MKVYITCDIDSQSIWKKELAHRNQQTTREISLRFGSNIMNISISLMWNSKICVAKLFAVAEQTWKQFRIYPTVRNPANMFSYLQLGLYIMDFKQIEISRHLP
jgi:hypothetical protein